MIMARHDTISAWFWITNSWLSTGGLLFFLRKPMAHRLCLAAWLRGCCHWVLAGLELASPAALLLACWPQQTDARAALGRFLRRSPQAQWTAARVFSSRHEDASHRAKHHSTTPTLFLLPAEVRWRALPLRNPIHEPPSVIDVEGEPGPVVPSRSPRKRAPGFRKCGQRDAKSPRMVMH